MLEFEFHFFFLFKCSYLKVTYVAHISLLSSTDEEKTFLGIL